MGEKGIRLGQYSVRTVPNSAVTGTVLQVGYSGFPKPEGRYGRWAKFDGFFQDGFKFRDWFILQE